MEGARRGQTFTFECHLHVESVFVFLSSKEAYQKRIYHPEQMQAGRSRWNWTGGPALNLLTY